MYLVIQYKKAHFCFNCAAVLSSLIKVFLQFGNIHSLVKTAFASPRTTENHWKLLAFSPLGPSPYTAQHVAIPRVQGSESLQNPIPTLSLVA